MGLKIDQECLSLAIQTVLHNNKNRIHLFMDPQKNSEFIQEMSEEILRRAGRYQIITDSDSQSHEIHTE